MPELKPCPFCGNSPRVNDLVDEYKQVSFAVSCDECGCNIGLSHDTNWLGHLFTVGDFSTEADAIEAWNSRPSVWVSVKDRLPDNDTFVIAWTGERALNLFFSDDGHWAEHYGAQDYANTVTHWTPLPEAPEGVL